MSRIIKSEIDNYSFNPPIPRRDLTTKSGSTSIARMTLVVPLDQTLNQIAGHLESRLRINLRECQFFLQDRVQLRGDSSLSSHCVQLEGLVQLLLEVKSMHAKGSPYGLVRLNVMDIRQTEESATATFGEKNRPQSNETASEQDIGDDLMPAAVQVHLWQFLLELLTDQSPGVTIKAEPGCLTSDPLVSPSVDPMHISPLLVAEALAVASRAAFLNPSRNNSLSNRYPGGDFSSLYAHSDTGRGISSLDRDSRTKWTVDKHYRRLMEMNDIPRDPCQWNSTQVIMWIMWASKHFQLDGVKLDRQFELPGKDLIALQSTDLYQRLSNPNLTFLIHFELLKRCREVCVPYTPQRPTFPLSQTLQRPRPNGRPRMRKTRFSSEQNSGRTGGIVVGGNNLLLTPSLPLSTNLRLNGLQANFASTFYKSESRSTASDLLGANSFHSRYKPPGCLESVLPSMHGFPLEGTAPWSHADIGDDLMPAAVQVHLWQFLLELLTDWRHRDAIRWVSDDGEFKLSNPEHVASLWGQRKNKPAMNYEKFSRALRYYYEGDIIAKVHGRRFVYKFICDLKTLLGFSAGELHNLVKLCAQKHLPSSTAVATRPTNRKRRSVPDDFDALAHPPPASHEVTTPSSVSTSPGDLPGFNFFPSSCLDPTEEGFGSSSPQADDRSSSLWSSDLWRNYFDEDLTSRSRDQDHKLARITVGSQLMETFLAPPRTTEDSFTTSFVDESGEFSESDEIASAAAALLRDSDPP